MDPIKPSSFVYGTNLITQYLRYCLVPYGLAYKFDLTNQGYRPRPLSILVVLLSCTPLLFLTVIQQIVLLQIPRASQQSDEYKAIVASVFVARLAKLLQIYRLILMVSSLAIVLTQHGCISNVIASRNNYLTDKEQSRCAKITFVFFCLNVIANTAAYIIVFLYLSNGQDSNMGLFYLELIPLIGLLFWTRLSNCTPLILTCYLSSLLGKHVENFSTIYIDTMFDQFMKAIEKEGEDMDQLNQVRSLPFLDTPRSECLKLNGLATSKQNGGAKVANTVSSILQTMWRLLVGALNWVYNLIRNIVIRLSMRKYPELPEMKMTKLSSTTKIQISERTRTANNHLIRVRLRRTQIMLGDLRDLVNDINRTSSPIGMMYLLYETMFIVLITTASVQAKVYKSINILIVPTISVTISLVSCVVYTCVCYDETNKQLRLLVNKLFDFIIMNHRVQSSGRQTDKLQARIQFDPERMCMLPGSEMGAVNETWSQFQYTRKLANTIQFTSGGIVTVSRRLVLSILGHVLSAVFISIEIMSIIDTRNMPHTAGHASSMSRNSSSSQYNLTDIAHHHNHHLSHRSLDL